MNIIGLWPTACAIIAVAMLVFPACDAALVPRGANATTAPDEMADGTGDDDEASGGTGNDASGDGDGDGASSGDGSNDGAASDNPGDVNSMQENPDAADAPCTAMALSSDGSADDQLDGTTNAEYLATLDLATVCVGGDEFLVWVVDTRLERSRGLMFVTEEEMADLSDGRRRGMLFVFQVETTGGFWMRNTITRLDIAYLEADGTVVTTYTMEPLDETIYRPDGPYIFALEMNDGVLAELGVGPGDMINVGEQHPELAERDFD